MKSIFYIALAAVLIILVTALLTGFLIIKLQAEALPQLQFTEIMYNPAGADADHEWLEIFNYSTSTSYIINADWRFNDGSNHQLSLVLGDELIEPFEYLVLAADDQIFLQDYPDYQGSLVDTVMSLNNSQDNLSLSVDVGQSFFATTTYQSTGGGDDNGYSLVWLEENWQESAVIGGAPGFDDLLVGPVSTSTAEITDDQPTSTDETLDDDFATSTPAVTDDTPTSTLETLGEGEQTPTSTEEGVAYASQIMINEILANPAGSDTEAEWLELYNREAVAVDLEGWQLGDDSQNRYTVSQSDYASTTIAAFGYFVVYRQESGLALNNDGDSVKLYQPDGNLLDQAEYIETAKDSWSYVKNGGNWYWTMEPTPGWPNVIKDEEPVLQCPAQKTVYVEKAASTTTAETLAVPPTVAFNQADYQGLMINEFMPDPQGSDAAEWVELYNASSSALALSGLRLDDAEGGSSPYAFSASASIPAFEYFLVLKPDSRLSLNNSDDSVRLLGPDDQIVQTVLYQGVKENWSYNYDAVNEEWLWSPSSTPGAVNHQPAVFAAEQAVNQAEAAVITAEETDVFYDLAEIKNLDKGVLVKTQGAVTALPGVLGKNIFYISAPDLSAGLQVYFGSVALPPFIIGDVLAIKGKTSTVQGEPRINLLKDSQPEIIGRLQLNQPELTAIDELDDGLAGNVIRVSGELVERQGNNYYLDDGSGELKVYLKTSADIAKPEVEEGYFMDVTGILSLTKSGYRLLPRVQADINFGQVLGVVQEIELSDEVITAQADNQEKNLLKYSVYGGSGLVVALLSLLIRLKFLK
ncbi:MAG: OB-fold nucleic acid binding domain protein [Parcubacteria group bacterium GW2011_GWA2_43_17]|nr:MAG: OB-fold nucleic acid binding domain protein [Parcubacteria group bacterium GW2011_GWA2_43_17]KKT94273.1 MAG: OB-fold nucleic acid binding domain protein [Parcubacteria group bacterium GW2011_GWF2_45_11]OGY94558.1 MAG: hypothetical protein A2260_00200 [Candidatus Komeilibacteria bacterium RIFOXYA2_FULL_45_9]HAH04367.1 hypothetical protein [Candidatus Komeilibacteria bacterium]HBR13810.1 hypothetical protein [Candidatus Komeilibacteria bacterium]